MMRLWFVVILYPFFIAPVWGQSKKAFNLIEKQKYDQAQESLIKNIEKDSLASEARYALSVLYFNDANPNFDADISYQYILESIEDFKYTEEKEREKMKKDAIDSNTLVNQKILIENYAFVLAKKSDKEDDYSLFLEKFATSLKVDSAIWFRDLRAFERVSDKHTWQAYKSYMDSYPNSKQKEQATAHYERLLFLDKTERGKLKDYKDFLTQYPNTRHRKETEENLFRIATGDHSIGAYEAFLIEYPGSEMASTAARRIALIDESLAITRFGKYLDINHLEELSAMKTHNLFVTYSNDMYQFQSEVEQIKGNYNWIPEEYKCDEISAPVLLVKTDTTRIINRLGQTVFTYPGMRKITYLVNGIIGFESEEGWGAVLESGELICPPQFDSLQVVQGRYLAGLKAEKWGMWSVNNLELFQPTFEAIEEVADLIKIGDNTEFDLVTTNFFLPYLDASTNTLRKQYSDLEVLDNELLLLYADDLTGLFTIELQPLIPMGQQEIQELPIGFLVEKDSMFYVHLREPTLHASAAWENADFTSQWLMLQRDSSWTLYSARADTLYANNLDSLHVINENSIKGYHGDSATYYFSTGKSFTVANTCDLEIIVSPPIKDQQRTYYYQVAEKDSYILLNDQLDTIRIPKKTGQVDALGREYLLYDKRDKRGLMDSVGNLLLDPRYDGIANYNQGAVTLLNDGVLGFYHAAKNIFIAPEYHRSPTFYSDTVMTVFKEEKFGLVSKNNSIILPIIYNEIEYFNDSVAWVLQSTHWSLVNIFTNNLILDNVTKHWQSSKNGDEHYFETTRGRGVAHSQSGMIINGNFNEIKKRGTQFDPIYITELFVNEAGLYIQVVYDAKGEIIFRHAYSEEEYDFVICEN